MQRQSARRASARKPALMISLRPLAWSAVALLALARVAAAGDAATDSAPPPTPPQRPADLGAPKAPAPVKSDDAAAAKDKDAAPAKNANADAAQPQISPEEAIARADAYLDSARMMTADFVQIGPDGQRSEGQLYVDRPGRMLFHYEPPARLEIVADGRSVAVRDQKLDTQDLYFIAQTPLKFLLKDHVDLAKDTTVKRVTIDDNAATIEIEDKATFGGSAEIALVFDPDSFALKQWTVIDAQGFQTVVSLFNVDLTSKPDPDLFHIDESGPTPQNPHH
jgi:outer membrane lipoprotein-sorting protein